MWFGQLSNLPKHLHFQKIFLLKCDFSLHDCFETIKNAKSLHKEDRFAFSICSSLRFRIKSLLETQSNPLSEEPDSPHISPNAFLAAPWDQTCKFCDIWKISENHSMHFKKAQKAGLTLSWNIPSNSPILLITHPWISTERTNWVFSQWPGSSEAISYRVQQG